MFAHVLYVTHTDENMALHPHMPELETFLHQPIRSHQRTITGQSGNRVKQLGVSDPISEAKLDSAVVYRKAASRPPVVKHAYSGSRRDPILNPSSKSQKLSLTRNVEYVGVLLDAGRHYYPVDWIYNMLDYLHLLGFNFLHFRLTDDQAFNIRLDSRPELVLPAEGSDGRVYTPEELRGLVHYAQSKNITIMPEINVPGHAGGFAGYLPRLVVPCAAFICSNGYGLPLNASHPELMTVLKDVMIEVKDIFSTTPFFHLGGDELEMSRQCFTDVNMEMLDYNLFEAELKKMLTEVGIEEEQVVRWEMTGQGQGKYESVETRVKGIDHYWYSRHYQDRTAAKRVFCSHGLYFDTNRDEGASVIYEYTRTLVEHEQKPIAIIAGAFELGVQFWMDRNVPGRLLAVAMGASTDDYEDDRDFQTRYQQYCRLLDLPNHMCEKKGAPLRDEFAYKSDWTVVTQKWKSNMCDRLATLDTVPMMEFSDTRLVMQQSESNEVFWKNFFQPPGLTDSFGKYTDAVNQETEVDRPVALQKIAKHKIKYTGIILDLRDGFSENKMKRLAAIFDYLAMLGFNMIQLRIMSDFTFALRLDTHHQLPYRTNNPYEMSAIKQLVEHAGKAGMMIMPELSVVHRAGGLGNAVHMAACPRNLCEQGGSLTIDTTKSDVFPATSSILRELRTVFSSPFVHLGHDERNESMACMREAKIDPTFDKVERKIEMLLSHDGIPLDKVLRWENEEQTSYKHRAGSMTHYRKGMPSSKEPGTDFFLSTGLELDDTSTKLTDAWEIYQHVQDITSYQPLGIMIPLLTSRDLILKSLNVRQRLLAMAIGLSVDGLGKPDFVQLFHELCEAARNKHCEEFGVLRDAEKAAQEMLEQATILRDNSCRRLLYNKTMARPKEGVLVEVGTDVDAMARPLYQYMDF